MRNTYNDTKVPTQYPNQPRNLNTSKERVTYTANQPKVQSYQKSLHTAQQNNH